jgi:hypothetical protein
VVDLSPRVFHAIFAKKKKKIIVDVTHQTQLNYIGLTCYTAIFKMLELVASWLVTP